MLFGPVALTPVVLLGSIPSTMRSSSTGGFDAFGRYVMQDYDIAKPMSDFLAGKFYLFLCVYICVCVCVFVW